MGRGDSSTVVHVRAAWFLGDFVVFFCFGFDEVRIVDLSDKHVSLFLVAKRLVRELLHWSECWSFFECFF